MAEEPDRSLPPPPVTPASKPGSSSPSAARKNSGAPDQVRGDGVLGAEEWRGLLVVAAVPPGDSSAATRYTHESPHPLVIANEVKQSMARGFRPLLRLWRGEARPMDCHVA